MIELTPIDDVAKRVGVPREAVELTRASHVVDLHLESFIPPRLWGYDLWARHDRHLLGGRFFGHLDIPRVIDGGLTGAMWSIATNITRGAAGRWRVLNENVRALRETLEAHGDVVRVVRNRTEYDAARSIGAHAALLAVQGGNAYENCGDDLGNPDITRVTVMHLSNSCYGCTSSPLNFGKAPGLTTKGRELVEKLDAARVFVDLAHIDRPGFWHAVEVHDRSLPLIDTHTGVDGVKKHWRNLDDDQIRAIADSGGVVGIMFEPGFLRARGMKNDARMVIRHLAHVIDVGGEDCAAIGSDYDGFIIPPPDLRDGFSAYYRLVALMLEEGFGEDRIRKILGLNFLRCWTALRPGGSPVARATRI